MALTGATEAGVKRRKVKRISDYVCPRDFLQQWNVEAFQATKLRKVHAFPDALGAQDSQNKQKEEEEHILDQIGKMMNVDDDTIQELADVCGKQTLYDIDGTGMKFKAALLETDQVPNGVQLECVKHQMVQRKKRKGERAQQISNNRQMKYNVMYQYLKFIPDDAEVKEVDPQFQVQVPNTVLTVTIQKCLQIGQNDNRHRECDTFDVLGTQPLSALRDMITCPMDCIIPGDYSALPDVDPSTLLCTGDLYKSSCFYIENTFYNDTRQPDNEEYSAPIIKWAQKETPEVHYSVQEMQKTQFQDLHLRLGCHYLFMHQGNCEHSVLFTDIRLLNSDDKQDIRQWPILTIERVKNRSVCQACYKQSTKWIVKDSPLIPSDPCHLCKFCFKALLYTEDGRKKSDFKAYHMREYFTRDKDGNSIEVNRNGVNATKTVVGDKVC